MTRASAARACMQIKGTLVDGEGVAIVPTKAGSSTLLDVRRRQVREGQSPGDMLHPLANHALFLISRNNNWPYLVQACRCSARNRTACSVGQNLADPRWRPGLTCSLTRSGKSSQISRKGLVSRALLEVTCGRNTEFKRTYVSLTRSGCRSERQPLTEIVRPRCPWLVGETQPRRPRLVRGITGET